MDAWALPGPATFLARLRAAVRDGANVVIDAPTPIAEDVLRAVDDSLQADQWSIVGPCRPEALDPIDALCVELGLDGSGRGNRSIASLVALVEERRIVLIHDVSVGQWPVWRLFLEEYARASRSRELADRAQIVFVANGVPVNQLPGPEPTLMCMTWDDVVGEADMLGYTLSALKGNTRHPPCLMKLIARTIASLALWDFALADRLIDMEWRNLFNATTLRNSLVALTPINPSFSWEAGGSGMFDGARRHHTTSLLAAGDPDGEVTMRLWAAQASELLPVLELCRRDLVKRMKGTHRVPASPYIHGEPVGDLADVEIGGLLTLAQAHSLPSDIMRTAGKYRTLRNKLAHLEPLSSNELYDFLSNRSH